LYTDPTKGMARSISILFVALGVISFASSFCVKPEMGGNVREICRLSMVYGTPRPVQIIPSILPADWANLGAECKRLEDAGVDRIQFDVMDGNFVPNLTFGPELIAACRKYTRAPFETQLMVSNYNCDIMLDQYTKATLGPNSEPGVIILHVEGNVHLHRALKKIRENGGSPSVALNPHTPPQMIEHVLDLIDHILVMTVNPGYGGQTYIPTMLEKIKTIRKWIVDRDLDVDIEVDGGIKADWTLAACADAGANCFIAGSGLFAYDDLTKGCGDLRKVAIEAQHGNVMPAYPDTDISWLNAKKALRT
jgi:ribulose-phosphate 3-epimerase